MFAEYKENVKGIRKLYLRIKDMWSYATLAPLYHIFIQKKREKMRDLVTKRLKKYCFHEKTLQKQRKKLTCMKENAFIQMMCFGKYWIKSSTKENGALAFQSTIARASRRSITGIAFFSLPLVFSS